MWNYGSFQGCEAVDSKHDLLGEDFDIVKADSNQISPSLALFTKPYSDTNNTADKTEANFNGHSS